MGSRTLGLALAACATAALAMAAPIQAGLTRVACSITVGTLSFKAEAR